jgi:hypothetical protein
VEFTVPAVVPESFTGMEPRYIRDTIHVPRAMDAPLAPPETPDSLVSRDGRILRGRLEPGVLPGQARPRRTGLEQFDRTGIP